MKLTADRASLADAVKWVTGAIDVRPAQPAMAGIRLEADADGVTLTGHNFAKVHTARVAAEVSEPGVAVPVALMVRDLLNALKGDTVDLSVDDNASRLTLKAGRSSYGVNTFAPGTWPEFPTQDAALVGKIPADELRRGMALVASAADDNNPVTRLRGVRLEGSADELVVVGISSAHIAATFAPWAHIADFVSQIPVGSMTEAVKGLVGEVAISVSDGSLCLADETRSVILRVYEPGEFPDWRKFMTEPRPGSSVEVEAELLRDACKRAALTCAAGNEPLTLDIRDGEVRISGAGDTATGSESIDYDGNLEHVADWTTSVLLPVLASLPPTAVTLSFAPTAGSNPAALPPMSVSDKAGSFRHVVMPRRARS